jgi:hypothetical protein
MLVLHCYFFDCMAKSSGERTGFAIKLCIQRGAGLI